jgi:surface antigen
MLLPAVRPGDTTGRAGGALGNATDRPMSPVHRLIRRHALLVAALFTTIGASFALMMIGLPDRSLAAAAQIDRTTENPRPHEEPLVDPRAERTVVGPGDVFLVPYGIERGICDRRQLAIDAFGGVVGLVGGSASERLASAGGDRPVYAVAGTAAGPLVGPKIARAMDEVDHHCIGRTLEYAPDNHRVRWQNEARDLSYIVVPVRTFQNDNGLYCREYRATTTMGGRSLEALASACRSANGSWKLLRSD